MSSTKSDLENVLVGERELWLDGPPHELFGQLRAECPVHWTSGISEYPNEAGYWSVTKADDVHAVSRDWRTYSSELGGVTAVTDVFPIELMRAMFIGMDPPKHDRIKKLFQAGFTPRRIADHEPAIRRIVANVLDRLEGRETCDLVTDVAQPAVSRVIGSFMGIPEEDDAAWATLMNSALGAGDPDLNPGRDRERRHQGHPRGLRSLLADDRRAPRESHRGPHQCPRPRRDRRPEARGTRDRDGLLPARGGGQRQHQGHLLQRDASADAIPDQRQLLIEDPSLVPGAVEEALRMFPAFAHFRRTATCDTELAGQKIREGEKVVMWYVSSNRDESRYEDPDRFDVRRNPEHQAFGAGGRHFCLGTALARLELTILFEETLARYPAMELAGRPMMVESAFLNQPKTMPVRLSPPS